MRDVALDNFKFILIAVVIIGHTVEPLMGRFDWVKPVYVFIYLFHMPMFAYVSGVVSSRKIDSSVIRSIVSKLIIPYLCLEIIYSICDFFAFSKSSINISPLVPYWILWYMFSLILWRVMLPFFSQFKFPIAFSIIAGLACGVNSYDYNLSFSRTFVFFPFFLVGHYYHSVVMEKIGKYKASRLIGSGILVIVFLVLLNLPEIDSFNLGWLYGSRSYSSLGVGWEQGVFNRLCIYILAFIVGVAVLAIAQKHRSIVTRYGEDSLYVYVLHGFVMKGLIVAGLYNFVDSGWKAVILILISLALLPMLSSRFSKLIADNMMNPLGITNALLANKTINR